LISTLFPYTTLFRSAFPQHGLLRNGEAFLTVIEEALAMGVTHIGGVDPATMDHDISGVIKKTFELAEKYGVGIDIHLHDSDTLRSEEHTSELQSRFD